MNANERKFLMIGLAAVLMSVSGCNAVSSKAAATPEVLGTVEFVRFDAFVARNGGCCVFRNEEDVATADSIQDRFEQELPFFFELYSSMLARDEAAAGRIELALAIASDGQVVDIGIIEDTTGQLVLAWEIVEHIKQLQFPSHEMPVRLLRYPLDFQRLD